MSIFTSNCTINSVSEKKVAKNEQPYVTVNLTFTMKGKSHTWSFNAFGANVADLVAGTSQRLMLSVAKGSSKILKIVPAKAEVEAVAA